jgi:hypothetical protein
MTCLKFSLCLNLNVNVGHMPLVWLLEVVLSKFLNWLLGRLYVWGTSVLSWTVTANLESINCAGLEVLPAFAVIDDGVIIIVGREDLAAY